MNIKALAAVMLLTFTSAAWPQGKPLACQEDANGGLNWENGRWNVARFHPNRFILVIQDGMLSKESVNKAFGFSDDGAFLVTCSATVYARVKCDSDGSATLYFNPKTNKGGIARLFGATQTEDKRDTLHVSAFTCQPF